MKIIKFEIEEECLLKITCKRPSIFKSYLEEIEKITSDLRAKYLSYKYFGWSFDKDNNIVFTFRLLDGDKDIKPYIRWEE